MMLCPTGSTSLVMHCIIVLRSSSPRASRSEFCARACKISAWTAGAFGTTLGLKVRCTASTSRDSPVICVRPCFLLFNAAVVSMSPPDRVLRSELSGEGTVTPCAAGFMVATSVALLEVQPMMPKPSCTNLHTGPWNGSAGVRLQRLRVLVRNFPACDVCLALPWRR